MDKQNEVFTFFWLRTDLFSQWHPSRFTLDGVTYCCAEQFMMAEKARLFGDALALAEILKTSDPQKQKALGQSVRGFVQAVWNREAKGIVRRGNLAKFSQNPALLQALAATADTTLVEASPNDRIWGIGLRKEDPRAHSRKTWRGTNWLGEVLTDVRRELIGR